MMQKRVKYGDRTLKNIGVGAIAEGMAESNADRLIEASPWNKIGSRKLTNYALDPENERGKDKAFMFAQHLGFTQDNYQLLVDQIENDVLNAEAQPGLLDQYGQRYQVDLVMTGEEAATVFKDALSVTFPDP